jgi:hypothetical protein
MLAFAMGSGDVPYAHKGKAIAHQHPDHIHYRHRCQHAAVFGYAENASVERDHNDEVNVPHDVAAIDERKYSDVSFPVHCCVSSPFRLAEQRFLTGMRPTESALPHFGAATHHFAVNELRSASSSDTGYATHQDDAMAPRASGLEI